MKLSILQLSKLSGGKSTIVDVKARDRKGNSFIVEIQVAEFDFFHKRILYYTSQSYIGQIDNRTDYNKLKPVYFIGILEFEIGNNPDYFSRHKVLDVQTNEQVIQDVEFNFIELPKFTRTISQLETHIDQGTYFIKNSENLSIIPESVLDEGLKEAYTEADKQNWTKEELEDYERAAIKERDEKGRIDFAEKKAKNKRNLEIAEKAKSMGLTTADISKLTGLSEEEIEKI